MVDRLFRVKWLVLLAFCFVFCSGSARAQAISGDLTGTVLDVSGATIPNASVVALNDATGLKTTAQTNAEGVYRFTNLPIGRYTIAASATGFTRDELKNVHLTLNNVVTAHLTLQVGQFGTTVDVVASAVVPNFPTCRVRLAVTTLLRVRSTFFSS